MKHEVSFGQPSEWSPYQMIGARTEPSGVDRKSSRRVIAGALVMPLILAACNATSGQGALPSPTKIGRGEIPSPAVKSNSIIPSESPSGTPIPSITEAPTASPLETPAPSASPTETPTQSLITRDGFLNDLKTGGHALDKYKKEPVTPKTLKTLKNAYTAFMNNPANAAFIKFPEIFGKCLNETIDPIERQTYCGDVTVRAISAADNTGNKEAETFALLMAKYDLTSGLLETPDQIKNNLILPLELETV